MENLYYELLIEKNPYLVEYIEEQSNFTEINNFVRISKTIFFVEFRFHPRSKLAHNQRLLILYLKEVRNPKFASCERKGL